MLGGNTKLIQSSYSKRSRSRRSQSRSKTRKISLPFANSMKTPTPKMELKFNLKNIESTTSIFINPKNQPEEDIMTLLENESNIQLFNVKQNVSLKQSEYRQVSKYIYDIAKRLNLLCKGLNLRYVVESFTTANAIIVVGSKNVNILPNGNVFGFASVQIDSSDNSLYIDVICSHTGIKYAGDTLMKAIIDLGKTLFITKIKLKSVNEAIGFYEKYGFVKQGDCDDKDELCEMIKKVTRGGRKTMKRRYNTHNSIKIKLK